jgi:hypothetical protein
LPQYEEFVYTLQQTYSSIVRSTLIIVRDGSRTGYASGELLFARGQRLVIYEALAWDEGMW